MPGKDYVREGLTVHWEPEICMHSGVCARSLPGVFRPSEKPWIDIEGADPEQIIATVQACPSGALTFSAGQDEPAADPAATVTIHPTENGPLRVEGQVSLVDADGKVVRSGERFSLCRCGHSASKPFCDGSHRKHGFTA